MRQYGLNLLTGSAAALVVSAAARALPQPVSTGSPVYAWFYQFTHIILANFDKVQVGNDSQLGSH